MKNTKLRSLIESHYDAKTIPDTASELLNDSRKLMKAYNDLYAMMKKAEETL